MIVQKVPERGAEQGVRAVRDHLFALEGVVLSESGAAVLRDVFDIYEGEVRGCGRGRGGPSGR